MQITEFFEGKYRIHRLRGKSPNTVRLYRSSLRLLDKVVGRPATLEDLTDDTIALVMQNVLDRGGSPYTANKERSQLLAIWRYAAQLGLISRWPTVLPEKQPERAPKAWLLEDVTKLLKTIQALDGSVGSVPARLWWLGLIYVCLDTGERIGAVKQATWDMLEHGWLLIPAEHRKGGKRDRRYRLSEDTLQVLEKMRPYCTREIFPWPYTATYLWNRYDKILQKAGLPHGPKDKFHRCRKTLGSVAYAAGLDPQEVLDHSSRRVSQAYLDARFTRTTAPSTILRQWLSGTLPSQQEKREQA